LNSASKIFLIILISFLSSCFGIKPGNSSSSGGDFESFYLGEGKNQYFIKPMEFESDDFIFNIDFTVRDFEFKSDGASANFSVISEQIINKFDTLKIITSKNKFVISDIQKMFVEKKGDDYHIRSTCKFNSDAFLAFFSHDELAVELYSGDKILKFKPTGKTNSIRKSINVNLVEILNAY